MFAVTCPIHITGLSKEMKSFINKVKIRGIIRYYNIDKGYGFIDSMNYGIISFIQQEISGKIKLDDIVEFDIAGEQGKFDAYNVKKINK